VSWYQSFLFFQSSDDIPVSFYGVYDGHAGRDAAAFTASHLHGRILESPFYPVDPVILFRIYVCRSLRLSYEILVPLNRFSWCQFHEHFTYSFYASRSWRCKNIQLSHQYLFRLSGSASVKAVRSTVMKLSPHDLVWWTYLLKLWSKLGKVILFMGIKKWRLKKLVKSVFILFWINTNCTNK